MLLWPEAGKVLSTWADQVHEADRVSLSFILVAIVENRMRVANLVREAHHFTRQCDQLGLGIFIVEAFRGCFGRRVVSLLIASVEPQQSVVGMRDLPHRRHAVVGALRSVDEGVDCSNLSQPGQRARRALRRLPPTLVAMLTVSPRMRSMQCSTCSIDFWAILQ